MRYFNFGLYYLESSFQVDEFVSLLYFVSCKNIYSILFFFGDNIIRKR